MDALRRVAFIDRDGTVNRTVEREGHEKPTSPYCFKELHIFDGAKEALNVLQYGGFACILVTNQPDIKYGNLSREEWEKIQREIEKLSFDGICICFHGKNDGCECRKPKPGMLLEAGKKWGVDFGQSFMIGDQDIDMIAGSAAGCKTILINAPYNTRIKSDFRARDLLSAARLIFHLETRRKERKDENFC